jgi:hypothetical protein
MARKGYRYEDPVTAPVSHWTKLRMNANPFPTTQQRRHGVRPSASEKRAAVADVRGKQESGLIGEWATADIAAQKKLISAHLDQYGITVKDWTASFRNAEQIRRESGG